MDKWGRLVEERLQEAFNEGAFENLPGKGKPLELDEDPLADPAQWMARHILRTSGMSLPWIEDRKRIEQALAAARAALARARAAYVRSHRDGCPPAAAERRWQQALAAFRAQSAAVNRRIRTYNLAAPHVRFQRCLIKPAREVARIERENPTV